METDVIKKGFVCGLLVLLISLSMTAAAVEEKASSGVQRDVLGTTQDPSTYVDQETMQQVMANQTSGYLIYSNTGAGGSIHLLAKIPHLRNSKGFCLGGIIVYKGLTALTMVWRITNGTASEVVKMRPGPHVVVFAGIGYSFFMKNRKGGSGKIVAVCLTLPSVIP